MKLLTLETSGKLCGVCLTENENIIDKIELDNGLTHSESLMPLIKEIMDRNNIKISNLDGFICDIGPGSFTGIRIGVATAKAFIDCSTNIIYTGVSSLESLAYNINQNGFICSIIDCKNDNCYFSLYKFENNNYMEIIPPTASSIEDLLTILKDFSDIIFVGDGAICYKNEIVETFPNAHFVENDLNKIHTEKLALAGYNKIITKNILELSPLYLKKPQAQRLLEEQSNC